MFRDTKFLKIISIIVIIINILQLTGLLMPALRDKITTGDTAMTIIVITGSIAGIGAAVFAILKKNMNVAFLLGAVYMLAIIYNQFTLVFSTGITVWGIISILAPVIFSDVLNAGRNKGKSGKNNF